MLGRLKLFVVGLLTMTIPLRALAQASLEIGPLAGAYAPTRNFGPGDYGYTGLPVATSDLAAMAIGLEARLWFAAQIGLEIQAAEAKSNFGGGISVCIPPPGGCGLTTRNHATITTIAAQVMYRPAAGSPLRLSLGAGVVRHGGAAYGESMNRAATWSGTTPVAVALGTDIDLRLGRRLVASLGVTTLVYALDLRDTVGQRYEHGTQVDLVPHLTVAWRWRMGSR